MPAAHTHIWRIRFRRILRWGLVLYLAFVVASRVWIAAHPVERERLRTGEQSITVPAADGDKLLTRQIQLAYYDSHPEISQSAPEHPVVLLVHGSPGGGSNFRRVIPNISPDYRVLAPDLPGFGGSDAHIPDYSLRAHAHYLLEMMDKLGVRRAHLVGFSMGGGVVLEMQRMAPDRVASITMLSGLGVQEMELTGNYWLNHIVHGFQHVAFYALDVLIPHFGKLDLNFVHSYTRNFYDSDQRPLRAVLQHYDGPMLIIHGPHDENVPYEAAQEHYRLVPQSEMQNPGDDHFMVFDHAPQLAAILNDFFQRVDSGKTRTRATAEPQRIAASNRPFDPATKPPLKGVAALAAFVLFALATLVNEESSALYAGFLSGLGRVSIAWALAGCFAGIFGFGIFLYAVGRLLRRARGGEDLAGGTGGLPASRAVARTRWTPLVRVRRYFEIGLSKVGWWRFAAWHMLFSAASVLVLGGLGALVGVLLGR